MNIIVFIVFIILIYIVYSLLYKSASSGDTLKNTLKNTVGFGSFLGYLGYFLLFIFVLTILVPTILFLIFSKREMALKPENRYNPKNINRPIETTDNDEDEDEDEDNDIPEFNFDTYSGKSNCPAKNNIEEFMIRKSKKQVQKEKVLIEKKKAERIHVDGSNGRMSGSRNLGGEEKKIELPEFPNVNSDKWVHISKIPDMKNYVHKKDLPCMSKYIHKKEIPNMSEYVHKTKIPPIKPLKKTSELPENLDTIKMDDIKKVYGIDMNNYILKSAVPQCLKCPDINDYVLKSSVPPF